MDIISAIAGIFKPAANLIDELHVSDEERGKLRNELAKIQAQMQSKSVELMSAEANSKHLITSIWRPVCSIILFVLILLDGFKVIEAPTQVYDLASTFLSVYAGGRSLEKISKLVKK
jgi:hypothetical protein